MRLGLILFILLIVSACTATLTASPTRVNTGVTAIPVTNFDETDEPQATELIDATSSPMRSTQEIIACSSAPPIRLIIQERGRVTDNNETLNLRNGPGISFDILTALDPRDEFVVIGGPSCDGGFAWFRVRFGTRIGWLAEGDFEEYYVEPYLTG